MAASSHHESLTWHKDYGEARKIGQSENKPLAVFIARGADGQDKVAREGRLSPEVEKALSDSYICIYVDTSTEDGQKLASAFGNTKNLGLVLSDRRGELQAFSQEGDLSAPDMNRWLKYFADPNVPVRGTMSNTSSQVSMYPPNGSMGYFGSQGYFTNGMIFGGG
jgi:hypothetical protein